MARIISTLILLTTLGLPMLSRANAQGYLPDPSDPPTIAVDRRDFAPASPGERGSFDGVIGRSTGPIEVLYTTPDDANPVLLEEAIAPRFIVVVNGISEDGEWLRIVVGSQTFWLPRETVELAGENRGRNRGNPESSLRVVADT